MNNRAILLVLVIIVVVAVGGGAFFLQQQNAGNTPSPDSTEAVNVIDEDDGEEDVNIDEIVELTLTAGAPETIEVVIATQDIPRGVEIAPNAVSLITVPQEFVPFSALTTIDDVVGQLARTDIARESFILSSEVVPDIASVPQAGSDAAVVLPPNRVAVAIPVDRLTSVAGAIQPGDRVDIIVSFLFVDVDPEFQTILPNNTRFVTGTGFEYIEELNDVTYELTFSENVRGEFDTLSYQNPLGNSETSSVIFEPVEVQRPRLATQTTVQDALILWKGDFPEDGRIFRDETVPTPTVPATPSEDEQQAVAGEGDAQAESTPDRVQGDLVTIAVSPQDAVVLTFIVEAGLPATFALRSASSTSLQQTQAVTLDYLLNRFNVSVPPKTGYSLEPAIRSIRSIDVGERIRLYEQGFNDPAFNDNENNNNNNDDGGNNDGGN